MTRWAWPRRCSGHCTSSRRRSSSAWISGPLLAVHRVDRVLVLLGDRPALELHSRCELIASGLPVAFDDRELLDLLDPGQVAVRLVDPLLDSLTYPGLRGQLLQPARLDALLLGPLWGVISVED